MVDSELLYKILDQYLISERKDRIQRALIWFRKGLGDNNLDEFISNWIGLEILNKILYEKFCGEYNEKSDLWKGVKIVFDNYLNVNETKFNGIKKKYRQGIMHGFSELNSDYIEKVNKQIPVIRKGLVVCICEALSLPKEIIEGIIKKDVMKSSDSPYGIIKASLIDLPTNHDLIRTFPVTYPTSNGVSYVNEDNDEIGINSTIQYKFRLPEKTKINGDLFLEMYGEHSFKKINLEINKKE